MTLLAHPALLPASVLSWSSLLVQRAHLNRIGLIGSPFPPRRWSLPRPRGLPIQAQSVNISIDPPRRSSSSVLLQSFAQLSPSRSPRRHVSRPKPGRRRQPRAAPLLDFAALQHIRIRRSTLRTASNPRCVPPAGFGHPLDGFLPPSPCRLCFTPTALVGLTPSKRSPFRRYRTRFRADEPTYRFLPPLFSTLRRAGPAGRGSWALTLPKVPRDRRRLSPPTRRWLPWGFSLPGHSSKDLDPHFGRSPLTRLPNQPPATRRSRPPTPTGRVSASPSAFA